MKKLIIAAVLCFGLTGSGFAQDMKMQREVKTPEERAKMMTDMMEKKLALTPEQKSKIYDLNLERVKKMEKMRLEEEKYRAKQLQERKELMQESDQKIQKILNAEQRKTYDEMRANMKDRGMRNHMRMDHPKMVKKQ